MTSAQHRALLILLLLALAIWAGGPALVEARAAQRSVMTGRLEPVSQLLVDEPPSVVVVLGLRPSVDEDVVQAIEQTMTRFQVTVIDVAKLSMDEYRLPEADLVVATGRRGCQASIQRRELRYVLCTLLTEEAYLELRDQDLSGQSRALVIDQPAIRQARVSSIVYPGLQRFFAFSAAGLGEIRPDERVSLDVLPFSADQPIAPQLNDELPGHDALIASSDSDIYNAATLSTLLLTAYGYGKPVIGFSRAYVNAGALLSCYTTPALIVRQLVEWLETDSYLEIPVGSVNYSGYFSVIDNTSVARSLGLVRVDAAGQGVVYSDADFQP